MKIKYTLTCMGIYPLKVMKENVTAASGEGWVSDQKDTEVRDDSDIQDIVST